MHRALVSRRVSRCVAAALLMLLATLTLAGCVRAHASLTVNEDDLVSGELVIATVRTARNTTGPELTVPEALSDRVRTEPYDRDGYVGTRLTMTDLTFTELSLLVDSITEAKQYRLTMRRSGNLVSMVGSIDLNQVPRKRADVRVQVSFPGTITNTNGTVRGGTITWTPEPGDVTEFSATTSYSDRTALSWSDWVTMVAAGAVVVALVVAVLALIAHRRAVRQMTAEEQR